MVGAGLTGGIAQGAGSDVVRERGHGGKLWGLVVMNRNIGNKEKELAVVFIAAPPLADRYYLRYYCYLASLRVCLEAGFDGEKSQLFDEMRRFLQFVPERYGQKKQRNIIK